MKFSIKIALYFSLILLTMGMLSCKKRVYDHAVIEFTYMDGTKEMISLCVDNSLVITLGEVNYAVRTKAFHNQSVDLEVVEFRCIYDTSISSFNLLKINQQQQHCLLNKKQQIVGPKSLVSMELVEIGEVNTGPGPKENCYTQFDCCHASCYSMVCCLGSRHCEDVNCQCTPAEECPSRQPMPTVREIGKIFSREKVNVAIPTY